MSALDSIAMQRLHNKPKAYEAPGDERYPHYSTAIRRIVGDKIHYVMRGDWEGTNTPKNFQAEAAREAELCLAERLGGLIALEPGEFVLYAESGDESFDVLRQDGSRRSGELVSVDRRDSLEISFNAISVNSREAVGYVYSAAAEVSARGELLIRTGTGEVFGTFPASDDRILLDRKNCNLIRFDRVDAIGRYVRPT